MAHTERVYSALSIIYDDENAILKPSEKYDGRQTARKTRLPPFTIFYYEG